MTEETLFKMEKGMQGSEIARYLRNIAEKLENQEPVVLESGTEKVSLDTDRDTVFEVKVEREGNEESLELEIEWTQKKDDFRIG